MNDPHARELFLDYHRGSLPAADAAALCAHLVTRPELQREFAEVARTLDALDAMPVSQPSPRLRAGVFAAIAAEKLAVRKNFSQTPSRATPPTRRPRWFWFAQSLAAGALLAVGFLAGTRHSPDPGPRPATQGELADLRRQVDAMSQLVLQPQPRPTNDRLKRVLVSARLENPDERVINELIGSLALDPSANVRLTALEALFPHASREAVRAGVLAALPREPSPLVQVAMIDFLAAARDGEAAPALDKISRSETADGSVRTAAQRALNQL